MIFENEFENCSVKNTNVHSNLRFNLRFPRSRSTKSLKVYERKDTLFYQFEPVLTKFLSDFCLREQKFFVLTHKKKWRRTDFMEPFVLCSVNETIKKIQQLRTLRIMIQYSVNLSFCEHAMKIHGIIHLLSSYTSMKREEKLIFHF